MPENRKTVLVLGGTGAMGVSLVSILAKRGMRIYVTSRGAHESFDDVVYFRGNAKNLDFLKSILAQKYDAIVDFMAYTTAELKERVDLLLASTAQYIFISSARVYAESPVRLTEDSPRLLDFCKDKDYLATDEYALSKARQEDILVGRGKRNYTIIRPSITYNNNRLQFAISEKEEWLYRAMHNRSIIFPKDMENVYTSMTYGGDVANAIAFLVGNEKAYGEIVQIASENALTWAEVLEIYQNVFEEKMEHQIKVVSVPDSLEAAKILGRYYQVKYARSTSRKFECSKLKLFTDGKVTFTSPQEGLGRCLTEFLENPSFGGVWAKPNAYFDRVAHERTPLSEFSAGKERIKYLLGRYTLCLK